MQQNQNINILEDWKAQSNRKINNEEDIQKVPLYKQYPNLKSVLPYIKLSELPTPIQNLTKFTESLNFPMKNISIYMKDDQVTAQKFSGNKVRKLEFLLADAKSYNCSEIYAVGAAGSNFTTATTVHCQNPKLNLKTTLFLENQINTPIVKRNLKVMSQTAKKIVYCQSEEDQMQQILQHFKQASQQNIDITSPPYFIPSGGSNPIGTIGYVNAAFELKDQIDQKIIPEPDYIYIPLGSAGTIAGLLIGIKLAKFSKTQIIPVTISGDHKKRKIKLIDLLNKTSQLLNSLDQNIELLKFQESDIQWCDYFDGLEYAQNTIKTSMVIDLLQKTENIQVDATYSSKALTALVQDIIFSEKIQQNQNIIFWNTFCSYNLEDQLNKNFQYQDFLPKQLYNYLISEAQPEIIENCNFSIESFKKSQFNQKK